jgi:uncharacterized membrane protein YbhN (UPF0104 family)
MTRSAWAGVRLAGVAAIAAVIGVRLGTGPFLTGLRSISFGTVAIAGSIAVVTTLCCAWRWWLVARGLGVPLRFGPAVLAYYRSLFLNGALPGGVIGDLHRGVRHGREARDVSRGLRAVLWERSAGQVVQVCVVLVVLALMPSPVLGAARIALASIVVAGLVVVLLLPALPRTGSGRLARLRRTVRSDLQSAVVAPAIWPAVVGTSIAVFAGHVATFVIAARAVGVTESVPRLVPLAMFVLLVAALPANVGGWGPREGAAAWTFAVAGLSGAQGVAVATAFGVLAAATSLPGAAVLITGWWTGRTPTRAEAEPVADVQQNRELVGAHG